MAGRGPRADVCRCPGIRGSGVSPTNLERPRDDLSNATGIVQNGLHVCVWRHIYDDSFYEVQNRRFRAIQSDLMSPEYT